jgi:uncharacterized protein YjbI with pentapeptide repeats
MSGAATGMTMERLIGLDVYLRVDNNPDLVEAEDEDGRILVRVTGIDPVIGLWVMTRGYPIKKDGAVSLVGAHILVPYRHIDSVAMIDPLLMAEDEGSMASSLEEAMQTEGSSKEDLEKKAATKVPCSRQSFRNAKLSGANLRGIVMRETDLERADLRNACFVGADLKDATLREINGEGADFSHAYLWEAGMEGANLHGAIFREANLYMANLKQANLQGAILDGANLVEVVLTDANLKGASLENVKLLRARLAKVQASDAEWKMFGTSLKKEGKEYLSSNYFSEARWCFEKALGFFQQAKDGIAASELKNMLEDLEEEEKLSAAIQKDRGGDRGRG